jgi:hypothetical protein
MPEPDEAQAGLVSAGASYPEPTVQRLQSVSSASGLNHGGNARLYEREARKVPRPERDGVQILNGKKVYVKTFRLGLPPGGHLPPEAHESNMRQTVEDVLKAGERVDSRTTLHSVEDDKLNRHVLMSYIVELV